MIDKVVATITLAFAADPLARWLYPDPADYLEWYPMGVAASAVPAMRSGTGYHTEDYKAVLLWMPPGITSDQDALLKILVDSMPEERIEDIFGLSAQMFAAHPDEPHWYMPIMAVDPTMQSHGIGAALLRESLEEIDRLNVPCFLETANPKSQKFFERQGFKATAECQIADSPFIVSMLRQKQENT